MGSVAEKQEERIIMSKRQSDEERVLAFFEGAHIERTIAVFNVIKGVIKRRSARATGSGASEALTRMTRKKRAALPDIASPVEKAD